MFVDLMNDVANTFTERFLKAQLVFEPAPEFPGDFGPGGGGAPAVDDGPSRRRRYNALGILEDIPEEEHDGAFAGANGHGSDGQHGDGADGVVDATYEHGAPGDGNQGHVTDVGPSEPPKSHPVARKDPTVVGAGSVRSLATPAAPLVGDLSNVGRNDPCPCGSGKKFKKCHGAHLS
ncbi:SEC-C metal-binding domain-containing protein [Gemmatirosa kalamazoonensis]